MVDFSWLSKKDFKIKSKDGLILIHPSKGKHSWVDEERWFRSLLLDENFNIVSSGWPKFGNYGEFQDDTKEIVKAIESGNGIYTKKEDGTLCIRYVHNGRVCFRTRSSVYSETFSNKFERVAKEKYPKLMNSDWMPHYSLLFEYVAPDNLIVVPYNFEDLIFIGGVKHDLKIISWEQTKNIAHDGKLNLVKVFDLPKNIKELIDIIKDWTDEGIVVRHGEVFVKIKSYDYLVKHRLKSNLTHNTIIDLICVENISTEEKISNYLNKEEFDWEIKQSIRYLYNKIIVYYNEIYEKEKMAIRLVDDFKKNNIIKDDKEMRKEFYFFSQSQEDMVSNFCMLIFYNKVEKLKEYKRKKLKEIWKQYNS